MSELAERISDVVNEAIHWGENHATPEMAEEEATDAILGLITEALLSEEAVEAFNEAATFDYYGTREAHMAELREGIKAMFAAAGLTTGGQGDDLA